MSLIRSRTTGEKPYTVDITPAQANWEYAGLKVVELIPNQTMRLVTGVNETLVLPLAGSGRVSTGPYTFQLTGRADVFAGVTDFCYLPRETTAALTSESGGRFALPAARTDTKLKPRYGPASEVPVDGPVRRLCSPEQFPADRLVAVEVLASGANWASPPRHSRVEEIYYFELPPDETPTTGLHTGDVVLVPRGGQEPALPAPGQHLYYLNVMAGRSVLPLGERR